MKFGDYRGVILYMQKDKFSPEQLRAWEQHYGIKLKQFYAVDSEQYMVTPLEPELGEKNLDVHKS
jgi:hypothetical protein